MKNETVLVNNETKKSGLKKALAWFDAKKIRICAWVSCLMFNALSLPLVSKATEEGGNQADEGWNMVMNFLLTWIPRLGGVLLFIGGVEFAIAYQQQDANGKTNATRLMVSGAMVIAIPLALKSLLLI